MAKQLCNNCLMRRQDWNDGGFCYFFKEQPNIIKLVGSCHKWETNGIENKIVISPPEKE